MSQGIAVDSKTGNVYVHGDRLVDNKLNIGNSRIEVFALSIISHNSPLMTL
jgi:hypothetical protein